MTTYVLPWLPAGVNANHQLIRGGKTPYLRPEVILWRYEVGFIVQQGEKIPDGRLSVVIDLEPPNKRRRDLDNTLKPILDSIWLASGRDDADIDQLTVHRRPPIKGGRITVTVEELGL